MVLNDAAGPAVRHLLICVIYGVDIAFGDVADAMFFLRAHTWLYKTPTQKQSQVGRK